MTDAPANFTIGSIYAPSPEHPRPTVMRWVPYDIGSEHVDSIFMARWRLEAPFVREALCFMDEDANVYALGHWDNGTDEDQPAYQLTSDPDEVLVDAALVQGLTHD